MAQPSKRTARIAPYRDAIQKAHAAGWTWADIARVLPAELDVNAMQLKRAMLLSKVRYEAEQLPLPTQKPTQSKPSAITRPNGRVGGTTQNPVDEIEAFNRRFSISSEKGVLK